MWCYKHKEDKLNLEERMILLEEIEKTKCEYLKMKHEENEIFRAAV